MEGWIASLSNGEHYFEAPPLPGEKTSWQKLKDHCQQIEVQITMLRLVRGGVTVNSLPKRMCSGYFQAYEMTRSFYGDATTHKQGVGSVVGDKVYITWISLDGRTLWQEIRPVSESLIHII